MTVVRCVSRSSRARSSRCTASAGSSAACYDLVRYLAAAGVEVTLITRTAAGTARSRRDRLAHRPAVRAVSHLPLRRPAGDDRPRSQHGVSVVRRAGRAGRMGARRAGGRRSRSRVRRERARLRAPPPAGARAARAQSAGAGGIRRDRSVAGPVEARRVPAASTRGAGLRARGRLRHRDRSRARARRPLSPRRSAGARARHSQRARSAGRRPPGRHRPTARACAARPGSKTTRRCC